MGKPDTRTSTWWPGRSPFAGIAATCGSCDHQSDGQQPPHCRHATLTLHGLDKGLDKGIGYWGTTNGGAHTNTTGSEEMGIWNQGGKEPSGEKGKQTPLDGDNAGTSE